jgi:hypothetical protein
LRVANKRPSNTEQHLNEIEEEESEREVEPGILEIFKRDEDAPISRDDAQVAPK